MRQGAAKLSALVARIAAVQAKARALGLCFHDRELL
jgi:hypothetical protein